MYVILSQEITKKTPQKFEERKKIVGNVIFEL